MSLPVVVQCAAESTSLALSAAQRRAGRQHFKLRAPWLLDPERSTEAGVQVDGPCSPLVLKVGEDKPLSMPVDAAWALWRCLGEALASTGEPPLWALREVQVTVPKPRRWPLPRRRRAVDVPAMAGGSDG